MNVISEIQRLSHVSGQYLRIIKMHVCLCVCVWKLKILSMLHCKGLARSKGFMKMGVLLFNKKLSDSTVYGFLLITSVILGSFSSRIYNIIALIPKGI